MAKKKNTKQNTTNIKTAVQPETQSKYKIIKILEENKKEEEEEKEIKKEKEAETAVEIQTQKPVELAFNSVLPLVLNGTAATPSVETISEFVPQYTENEELFEQLYYDFLDYADSIGINNPEEIPIMVAESAIINPLNEEQWNILKEKYIGKKLFNEVGFDTFYDYVVKYCSTNYWKIRLSHIRPCEAVDHQCRKSCYKYFKGDCLKVWRESGAIL